MNASTLTRYHQRVLAALVHIQRHLDDELPLEELARVACFSSFHFHRIFCAMTGESLKEHIRRLRLERAAGSLKAGRLPVTRLALEAGYDSHEAFTRAFRARFGCSPSAYRRNHRRGPGDDAAASWGSLPGLPPSPQGDPPMNIEIIRFEPLHLAFTRGVGPYAQAATEAWARLCAWAAPRGFLGPGLRSFGICHDDPEVTPPERIRYDAAIPVPAGTRGEGEIGVLDLPGGDCAVMEYRGDLQGLKDAWSELAGAWLPRSGREMGSSPSFEEYLSAPSNGACHARLHLPLEGLD